MSAACGRNARSSEHFAANDFSHVTRVLHRVVEMDLIEAMKFLAVVEFIEIQRQGWHRFEPSKAPGRAFQMNGDVLVYRLAFAHRRAHVTAAVLLKPIEICASDVDGDLRHFVAVEEIHAGFEFAGGKGGLVDGKQSEKDQNHAVRKSLVAAAIHYWVSIATSRVRGNAFALAAKLQKVQTALDVAGLALQDR